jgi:hypothetical protein
LDTSSAGWNRIESSNFVPTLRKNSVHTLFAIILFTHDTDGDEKMSNDAKISELHKAWVGACQLLDEEMACEPDVGLEQEGRDWQKRVGARLVSCFYQSLLTAG